MPVVPFRAPHPPRPFDQTELDARYWHSDDSVARIAADFGLTTARVRALATPQPTTHRCLLCGATASHRSRASRTAEWLECDECGAAVRQRQLHSERRQLQWQAEAAEFELRSVVDIAVAVVRSPINGHRFDVGRRAFAAVDALMAHGFRFGDDALVRVVHPLAGRHELRAALLASCPTPTLVGVPSLRTLGATQTEALATLVSLTDEGWRIASAYDVEIGTSVGFRDARPRFDRASRVHETDWVDDPVDRDGLRSADHLINATVEF